MIIEIPLLISLFNQCQATVDSHILGRIVDTESDRQQYAIAVVGAESTLNQPKNKAEAIDVIKGLESAGFSYSVGLMQINNANFAKHGLTLETAFDNCENIRVGAEIFSGCFERAEKKFHGKSRSELLDLAASCYYSGNFERGFTVESTGTSYVQRFNSSNGYSSSSSITNYVQPNPSRTIKSWDVFGDF